MSELTLGNSPVYMILITAVYCLSVFKIAPQYMKNRPAYKLHTFLRVYNAFQVVVNFWLVSTILNFEGFQITFLQCIRNEDLAGSILTTTDNIIWWTLLLKIFDLSETVVFILRKKQRQITFLHLYHHISTIWICWFTLHSFSTPLALMYLVINSSVHVIMYSYYLMATIKNPVVEYITRSIKSIITIVQMVQFTILLLYNMMIFAPGCRHMWPLAIVSETNLIINFALFYNFYKTTYKKPKIR